MTSVDQVVLVASTTSGWMVNELKLAEAEPSFWRKMLLLFSSLIV